MPTLKMGSTTVLTDTTLANAVQDNVTRLGTVTVGNLSNTAIVHRQGHILQCKGDNYVVGGATSVTSSSTTPYGTNVEVEITCASTSNFLALQTGFPDVYLAANTSGVHIGFVYSTDNWTSYSGFTPAGNSAVSPYVQSAYNFYNMNENEIINFSLGLWASVPTATTMKIRPYAQSGGGTYSFQDNGASFTDVVSLTVMEVQG